jgi:tetratricopeptide (TPR) repeat protein
VSALEQAISTYRDAVQALENAGKDDVYAASLQALGLRDKIASALDHDSNLPEASLKKLVETDRRLTALATKIDLAVGRQTLKEWRRTRNPDDKLWWWKLDEVAAAAPNWSNRFSTVFALVFLTISVALAADTFNTLRSLGANPVTTIGTLLQGALALIAASAFTESGRKVLMDKFSHPRFGRREFKGWARAALGFVVLGLAAVTWFSLPMVAADYFRRQGEKFSNRGLTQQAIAGYQQAVSLQPLVIQTRLELAKAEEQGGELAQAIEEYKSTIALSERLGPQALNDSYYDAKTSLARLYILEQNYRNALLLLNDVQDNIAQVSLSNRKEQFHLVLTYSGWANLELKHLDEAETDLNAAIGQKEQGAAAHYLLACTLQELKQEPAAKQQWARFIQILQQFPDQKNDVQMEWISNAQEQLTKGDQS